VQMGNLFNDAGFVFDGVDAVELGGQLVYSGSIDALFVHAGGPVVADLLLDLGAAGLLCGGEFHGFAGDVEIPDVQATACSPDDLVGGDGVGGEPLLAGVFVEVLAGVKRAVGQLRVEVLELGGFVGGGLCEGECAKNGTE